MQKLRENLRWYALGALFVLVVFIWAVIFSKSNGGKLTVAFLDVGQGDAIFIEAPSGAQMLIDGGAGKNVLRELSAQMPFYDRSIDIVLATHPDKDHTGGLPDVLERYDVGVFFEPGVKGSSGTYKALENLVSEKNITHVFARRGTVIRLDENVSFNILFPDRNVSEVESNTASVVGQLVYGDTEFLLTGDSPKSIEEYLVALDGDVLESDVLKAGHHGSKTSSAESFVALASPTYAVISAGEENRYGHPHKETLNIFENLDSEILETKNGTVVFVSDGLLIKVLQ